MELKENNNPEKIMKESVIELRKQQVFKELQKRLDIPGIITTEEATNLATGKVNDIGIIFRKIMAELVSMGKAKKVATGKWMIVAPNRLRALEVALLDMNQLVNGLMKAENYSELNAVDMARLSSRIDTALRRIDRKALEEKEVSNA